MLMVLVTKRYMQVCWGGDPILQRKIHGSVYHIPPTTSRAEAMSMREGLALANLLGCNNVIMEYDSLETVEACSGGEAWWGESSAIFTYFC
jgi:hypothetical protein